MSGKVQIIHTPSGDAMVVLPLAQYEALLAASHGDDDDGLDLALYDARKQELAAAGVPSFPSDVTLAMLRGETRLAAIRAWRGLSQIELARRAGLAQGYVSDIERGRRTGGGDAIGRLAGALDVPDAWLS